MANARHKRKLTLDMAQPASVFTAVPIAIKKPTSTARWVTVTPELATRWLEEANTNNRPVRDDYVSRLASDMANGKWCGENGEAIRFDENGRLVDGQHRLYASALYKCSFETLLVEKVPVGAYSTIGIGAGKAMRDFLGPMHHEKNVHVLASLLKLVYMWERDTLSNLRDGRKLPTIPEMEKVLEELPNTRVTADWVANHKQVRDVLVGSFAALLHFAGCAEGKQAAVESFLLRLGDGVGLEQDDPTYKLREMLLKERGQGRGHRKVAREYILAIVIKAWNMTKAGVKCRHLRIDETFPVLAGARSLPPVPALSLTLPPPPGRK